MDTSCKWIHIFLSFCDRVISLIIKTLRLIYIVACVGVPFVSEAELYSFVNATFRLPIHLLMDAWVASTFCSCG